jgi:hypothetical protein
MRSDPSLLPPSPPPPPPDRAGGAAGHSLAVHDGAWPQCRRASDMRPLPSLPPPHPPPRRGQVREALDFSASLRLPPGIPVGQRRAFVAEVLHVLELDDCADRLIGGLSPSQLKRVSIGVELASNNPIIALDGAWTPHGAGGGGGGEGGKGPASRGRSVGAAEVDASCRPIPLCLPGVARWQGPPRCGCSPCLPCAKWHPMLLRTVPHNLWFQHCRLPQLITVPR